MLLIEAGASLLIKDYQCYTPYQRSVQSGDEELMKYLQGEGRGAGVGVSVAGASHTIRNVCGRWCELHRIG